MSTQVQKEKKKKSKKKIILIVLGVIAALAAVVILAGILIFKHYYGMLDYQAFDHEKWVPVLEEEVEEEPLIEEASEKEVQSLEETLLANLEGMKDSEALSADVFNILLIGVDSRKDSFAGRSDSMILFSINQKTNKVIMTSFLRDIYVSIPEHGFNRLNAAYAYGGTSLLTDTIEQNFGISVDRCMVINFYLVMEFVDAINGVDIDLSGDEIRVMNNYIAHHNKLLGQDKNTDLISPKSEKTYHLNGNQALAYARVRYVGTDFARTGRQRTIIMLALEKVKKMNLGEMNELLIDFLPKVRTDLTEGDCANLLLMLLDVGKYSIESMAIPVDGTWSNMNVNKMAVLKVDFSANTQEWYNKVN